ncbi:MAG: hypothetical protein RL716_1054 [Actinomycetota bacterium]|jgi:transcriptional regulator with XRE-family HTH domain
MDTRATVREFLVACRSRLTPEDAGLQVFGGNRRVAGLRREEVAMLAGVSNDYYVRLERGHLEGASDSVLNALARALQLDATETGYLFDLARAARIALPSKGPSVARGLRPNVARILDAIHDVPVFVTSTRLELLGANKLGQALYSPIFESGIAQMNIARWIFLDEKAKDFYVDYPKIADSAVGTLRLEALRSADDPKFTSLIGELSSKSELFRNLWAKHRVFKHPGGVKSFNHPLVGLVTLTYEPFQVIADTGVGMNIYTAEPGSETEEKLKIIGAWAAENQGAQPAASPIEA